MKERTRRNRISWRGAANGLLNRLERRLGRERLRSRPTVVDVVLTKACNLSCTFCRDYEHPGARKVGLGELERVAAELFPTARWVNVCSGGEPYLHPGLEDLLRLARDHGAKRWVLSNGMLLEAERMRRVVEEELVTLHGISIDGIEPATVESIRLGAKLPRILANVDRLLELRAASSARPMGIVVRYALMRRNLAELPAAVRHWGARGIERLDASWLALANGMEREESLFFHQERAEATFAEARAAAREFPGLELRLPAAFSEERARRGPSDCRAPWEFVMIDASGRVLPCYRAFEAIHMGTLYGEAGVRFGDLWNGPSYRALRRTVNDDARPKHYPYCAVCEYRHGWGRAEPHLGDETWTRVAFDDPEAAARVDHRRPGLRGRTGTSGPSEATAAAGATEPAGGAESPDR